MKKNITFIKFIKPKIKEKERTDKAQHKDSEIRKIFGNSSEPGISLEDISAIFKIFKKL